MMKKIFTNQRMFVINVVLVVINLFSAFVISASGIGGFLALRFLGFALLHIIVASQYSSLINGENKIKEDIEKQKNKDKNSK